MALTAAFQERLEQMERARNERLSLLQAEKELQASKCQALASRHSNIRYAEQRCLMLEQKIALQSMKISVLKSEIDNLNTKYCSNLQKFRSLKNDVEELEDLEKERDKFYGEKSSEMEEFKDTVSKFVMQCRVDTQELQDDLKKHLSDSMKIPGPSRQYNSSKVAAAETLRQELLVNKRNLDGELASNEQTRAKLQKVTSGS